MSDGHSAWEDTGVSSEDLERWAIEKQGSVWLGPVCAIRWGMGQWPRKSVPMFEAVEEARLCQVCGPCAHSLQPHQQSLQFSLGAQPGWLGMPVPPHETLEWGPAPTIPTGGTPEH